jgi:hypothetical protein
MKTTFAAGWGLAMNNLGIRYRVLLLALLPLALVALGLTGYFSLARYSEMDRSLEERTLAMASQLAQSCEFALFSGDANSLDQLARPVSESGDVRGVTIAGPDRPFPRPHRQIEVFARLAGS